MYRGGGYISARKQEKQRELIREYEMIKQDENICNQVELQQTSQIDKFETYFSGDLFSFDKMINQSERRKMYKILLNVKKIKPSTISLKYCKKQVQIFFAYQNIGKKCLVHLRDIIKANHQTKNFIEPQFIFGIYSHLYHQVSDEYRDLAKWAFYYSKDHQINLDFNDQSFFASKKEYKIFYAQQNSGIFWFYLVNHRHDSAKFSSQFIEQKKHEYPQYYNLYLDFKKQLYKQLQIQQDWNFRGFGQLDSESEDEDEEYFSKQRSNKIQNINQQQIQKKLIDRISILMQRDMTIQRDRLAALQTIEQDNQDQTNDIVLNRIQSQYHEAEQLKKNLQNFERLRSEIKPIFEKLKRSYQKPKIKGERLQDILKKMMFAQKLLDSKLPILANKQKILKQISQSNLIILQAQTGSGKSTQLPQILNQYYGSNQNQSILITQPFKLATRTLAQRICFEMEQQLHEFIQYQTSMHTHKINPYAKIYIKLDRLVINQLAQDPLLKKYCCLVIDQAHQRTLSIDIILGKIKDLLNQRKDFKVIITSASLQIKLFQKYFMLKPLNIPGRIYTVAQIYKPLPKFKNNKEKIYQVFKKQILNSETGWLKPKYKGHVLVFCPSIEDIMQTLQYLKQKLDKLAFKILPLHPKLTPKQQKEAFAETKKIKVILATNFAETSITINGVKVVIDTGYDREMVYDHKNRMYTMIEKRISASSAKQRAGRAGRTSEGYCFRLYSRDDKYTMETNKLPEISNIALDSLVLRLKYLGVDDVYKFPYLTHPGAESLQASVRSMKMAECLTEQGELTMVGKFLANCPIEPIIGRAIVEALFYSEAIEILIKQINKQELQIAMDPNEFLLLCGTQIIKRVLQIISIITNSQNLFLINSKQDHEKCSQHISEESEDYDGDFYFLQHVYSRFLFVRREQGDEECLKWASKRFLSYKALMQARETELEIETIMKKSNLQIEHFKEKILQSRSRILKFKKAKNCLEACLASSFLPNLSLYSQNPQLGYTIISEQTPLQLSSTSVLSVKGVFPKWILCYGLYPNECGQTVCKVAQPIDFQLIKMSVSEQLMKSYGILQAEKKNPFYEKMSISLPTRIFQSFLQSFKKRNSYEHLQFLKNYSICFNFIENSLAIFSLNRSNQSNLFEKIKGYISHLSRLSNSKYTYQYIGNIQVCFQDGLIIQQLKLQEPKFIIKLYLNDILFTENIVNMLKTIQNINTQEVDNQIKIMIMDQETRVQLNQKLQKLHKKYPTKFQFQELLSNKGNKIPKYFLNMKIYTGEPNKEFCTVFLNYHAKSDQYYQKSTKKNYAFLMGAKVKLIKKKQQSLLRQINIKKSKTLSGINLFHHIPETLDQFSAQKLLIQYQNRGILSSKFQFPWKIMVFRTPVQPYCNFLPQYWEEVIKQKFNEIGTPDTSYSLRVRGWRAIKGGKVTNQFSQMNVKVESFDDNYLKAFKRKYDQKTVPGLGIGKLHIDIQLIHNVGHVRNNIFNALKQQYLKIVKQAKASKNNLYFQVSEPKLMRVAYKVFIKIRGKHEDRKNILDSARRIKDLFTPFTMKIEPKYYYLFEKNNFLCNTTTITQRIQMKFNYQVYFIFDKTFSTLFIYSPNQFHQQIKNEINIALLDQNLVSQIFSFKGSSLSTLATIIKKQQQKIIKQQDPKRICLYDVRYQESSILLTADTDTLNKLRAEIMQIKIGKQNPECEICCGYLFEPYQLINCNHSFCRLCLSSYIKQQGLSNNKGIFCPKLCGQKINNNDITYLLQEEQLHRICDNIITKFASNNPNYHTCYTPDCPQIFTLSSNKLFECPLCGIQYCRKCKNSHEGEQCVDMEEVLKKMNIKRCPKCSEGLQKNGGCNHMSCKSCGAHICWNCLEYFGTQRQCYKHLQQVHGRISDQFAFLDRPHRRMRNFQLQFDFDF